MVAAVVRLVTTSPEETEAAGASLAGGLCPGDVVLVGGELGSGKTTLIRGASRALGVAEPVTIPTFTIGQRYRGAGRLEVAHLDLYRLGTLAGEAPALLADYLTEERVGFVEWPALAAPELAYLAPGVRLAACVRVEHARPGERAIEIAEEDGP